MMLALKPDTISNTIHHQIIRFRRFLFGQDHATVIEIQHTIEHHGTLSASYIILLISATLLATLGLMNNSAPVIIGAMIVSPLVWPITGIAFGIAFASKRTMTQGISMLLGSILTVVVISLLISYASPVRTLTPEIINRTNPTIIDLIVATISGILAGLSLTHRRISESLAGVAIATALLPPLCVTGIGLALGDTSVALGGLVLSLSNIVAILLVATLLLLLLGGRKPRHQELRKNGLLVIGSIFLLLTVFLVILFLRYIQNIKIDRNIQTVLQTQFARISPEVSVRTVTVSHEFSLFSNQAKVYAEVFLPESVMVTQRQRDSLVNELEQAAQKSIDLTLQLQRVVSVLSPEESSKQQTEQRIRTVAEDIISKEDPQADVDNILITFDPTTQHWQIKVIVFASQQTTLSDRSETDLELALKEAINQELDVTLSVLPTIELSQTIKNRVEAVIHQVDAAMTVIAIHEGVGHTLTVIILPSGAITYAQSATQIRQRLEAAFPEYSSISIRQVQASSL